MESLLKYLVLSSFIVQIHILLYLAKLERQLSSWLQECQSLRMIHRLAELRKSYQAMVDCNLWPSSKARTQNQLSKNSSFVIESSQTEVFAFADYSLKKIKALFLVKYLLLCYSLCGIFVMQTAHSFYIAKSVVPVITLAVPEHILTF